MLLVLAAIGVLVCVGTASAASRDEVGARIINGSSAPAGAWPSIAYLGFTLNSQPSSIAVDSAGNVFTANAAADTISKITPGTPNATVYPNWARTGSDSRPVAIVIDSNGAGVSDDVIYAAIPGSNSVSAFESDGDLIWSRAIGTGPVAIALDSAGNVYTANFISDTVTKITPGGDVEEEFADTGDGPFGIVVDSAGNVYTANAYANTVTKITPGDPVVVDLAWADTGLGPVAIAVDSSNSVYTANSGANTVTKITSAGVVSAFGSTGSVPAAIAIGTNTTSPTDDDVFTANQTGSTVTKITAGGTGTPVWAVLNGLNASCTGSVIAPSVILTAAHCTMNENGSVIAGYALPGVIDAADTTTGRNWAMDYLLPHPDYDPNTLVNDVALVVLDNPTSAPAMPLIAPWQDALVVGGAPATIAGWGRTVNGGSPSRFLQEAAVPLISDADCARDQSLFNPAVMLCAGDLPAGIDTCQGDSGGPLAMTIAGTRTLVGDTSFGPQECATGPGVYGRISAFRSWILNDTTVASARVRSHLQSQNAAARGLELRSTGPNVTLTWGVSAANWTTTGFRVSINGAAATVTGPTTARTMAVPAGGVVTATVEPQVTLGTATPASISVKPTPTRAPVVSATTPARPRVGARLRVTASSDDPWGGAVSYQWLADGVEISGATSAGYRPVAGQAGQRLSLRVAATNAVGTGTTTVVAGRVRQAPRVRTGQVAVTGEARVGGRLQARPSAVTGFPQAQASYRWFRDGRRVFSATGAVYRVRAVDAGAFITGRVTWTNAVGTVTRSLRPVTIAG